MPDSRGDENPNDPDGAAIKRQRLSDEGPASIEEVLPFSLASAPIHNGRPSCAAVTALVLEAETAVQGPEDSERASERKIVLKVFGHTQGPAGSMVSEGPSASIGRSDEQPSEFEPGVVGIEDPLRSGDQAGADAALRAADRARMRGSSDAAVLDALEVAEDVYDSSHPAAGPSETMNKRLSSKLSGPEGSGSPAAGVSDPSRSNAGGISRAKGLQLDETVRRRVRQKFDAAMQRNAALGCLGEALREQHAAVLEAACQTSSSSRPVYNSKAGNLSRLIGKAASAAELSELPRIASGAQKDLADGKVAEKIPIREDTTGLQGVVMK